MRKIIDITNQKFGRLLVISITESPNVKNRCKYWKCICDCGNTGIYNGAYLRNGDTQSCGCRKLSIATNRLTKHGHYGTPTYRTWRGMINRCYNNNDPAFKRYGGRGIDVYKSWKEDFLSFLSDMGPKPKGKSLDRIDNEQGYNKENCQWATAKQQARNTRKNILQGETFNGWTILERVEKNKQYQAKAQCIKCSRIVVRLIDNLKR